RSGQPGRRARLHPVPRHHLARHAPGGGPGPGAAADRLDEGIRPDLHPDRGRALQHHPDDPALHVRNRLHPERRRLCRRDRDGLRRDRDRAVAGPGRPVALALAGQAMKTRANLGWSVVGAVTALLLAALWVAPLLWAASTALRPEHETV